MHFYIFEKFTLTIIIHYGIKPERIMKSLKIDTKISFRFVLFTISKFSIKKLNNNSIKVFFLQFSTRNTRHSNNHTGVDQSRYIYTLFAIFYISDYFQANFDYFSQFFDQNNERLFNLFH